MKRIYSLTSKTKNIADSDTALLKFDFQLLGTVSDMALKRPVHLES